jgi:hypothetical protein
MRLTSQRRHPFLPVVDGRLPDLPFADASFDVVVANFVLNHVRSPRSSAGELGRLASELVVATTWTVSPSWFWALVVARAGLEPHAGERLPADEDFERTADGFRGMLADAGLNGVTVSEHTWVWRPTARMLWASVEGGVAGAGAHYATLDASERQRFRAAFDAVVEEKRIGGVVPLEHRAAIAVARA